MGKVNSQKTARDQARQETMLLTIVCAVALIAMISVFVPGLRHFWIRLAKSAFGGNAP